MGGHSYHSNYGGGRRINYGGRSGGGGGGDGCSTLLVYGISFLVTGIFVYILVISIVFPKASNHNTSFSLSETRIIGASSTWYEKLSLGAVAFADIPPANSNFSQNTNDHDYNQDVQLLKFKSRPPLSRSDSWVLNESYVPVDEKDYYDWSWYFYKGSTIEVRWNYDLPLNVYLIKSDKGFKVYQDDGATLYKYTIKEFTKASGEFKTVITTDETYYVVFENWDNPKTAYGSGFFDIFATLLDVSNPVFNCSLPCSQPISYSSNEVFVVTTPSVAAYQAAGIGSANTVLSFDLHKYSRVGFIVGVVYILPIFAPILLVTCCILMACYWENISDAFSKHSSTSSSSTHTGPSSDVPLSTISISSPTTSMGPSSPPPETLGGVGILDDPYPLPPAPSAPPQVSLAKPNPFDSPNLNPPVYPSPSPSPLVHQAVSPPHSPSPSQPLFTSPPSDSYPPGEAPPPM